LLTAWSFPWAALPWASCPGRRPDRIHGLP